LSKKENVQPQKLFDKLRWGQQNLPSRQRNLCSFILSNYQKIVFLTVEELSKMSGASPSTVVRTVANLGFKRYRDLQDLLQAAMISTNASLWWQLEQSWERRPPSRSSAGEENPSLFSSLHEQLRHSWSLDPKDNTDSFENHALTIAIQDNIEALIQSFTYDLASKLLTSADIMEKASRIFLFGMRSCQGVSRYAFSLFHQFMSNVFLADRSGSDEMFDDFVDMKPEDCILALSFGGPHYTLRSFEALQYANSLGVKIILLTTDLSNPAASVANIILALSPARRHYTMAPALSVLEALVIELGRRQKPSAKKKLRELERILIERKITI